MNDAAVVAALESDGGAFVGSLNVDGAVKELLENDLEAVLRIGRGHGAFERQWLQCDKKYGVLISAARVNEMIASTGPNL